MNLRIKTDVYQSIVKKIGSGVPEKGGILLGGKDGVITDFIFDENAETTASTYSLNIAYLNPIIKAKKQEGKRLLGIIHSHPFGYSDLSLPDKQYFQNLFQNFPDLDYLFCPIVFSAKQGEFDFFAHVFHKDGSTELAELEILPNDYHLYELKTQQAKIENSTEAKQIVIVIREQNSTPSLDKNFLYTLELVFFGLLLSSFFIVGMYVTFFLLIKYA